MLRGLAMPALRCAALHCAADLDDHHGAKAEPDPELPQADGQAAEGEGEASQQVRCGERRNSQLKAHACMHARMQDGERTPPSPPRMRA